MDLNSIISNGDQFSSNTFKESITNLIDSINEKMVSTFTNHSQMIIEQIKKENDVLLHKTQQNNIELIQHIQTQLLQLEKGITNKIDPISTQISNGNERLLSKIDTNEKDMSNVLNHLEFIRSTIVTEMNKPQEMQISQLHRVIKENIENIEGKIDKIVSSNSQDSKSENPLQLGLNLYNNELFEEACEIFQLIVSQNPTNHKAWNYFGVSLSKVLKYSEAKKCFNTATILAPKNETYLKNLNKIEKYIEKPIEIEEPPTKGRWWNFLR